MDLEKVVPLLDELRERLERNGAWSNPVLLSTVAGRLSTYNGYLGQMLPRLQTDYERKKSEVYAQMRNSGASIADSENKARMESLKEKLLFESVKQRHADTKVNISVIQSHLKVLTEQERGNI